MAVRIVIPREEIESYVWRYILERFNLDNISEESRRKINTAVKVMLDTNRPIEYAYGVCRAYGVPIKECILNAAAKYISGWLEDYIVKVILEERRRYPTNGWHS